MLKYSEEFMKKDFVGVSMKDAYLKACKWYASNVLAKDELHDVTVEYVKDYERQSPTVTIHLFVTMEEQEVRSAHCEICKEMHSHFYCNDETNCNWCNVKGYQNRCDQRIKVKKEWYKREVNK